MWFFPSSLNKRETRFLALRFNSLDELETLLMLDKHQLTLFILCHFLQIGLLNKYFMAASLLS